MTRLTIVQYGGDYREAYDRFASGGAATYQAQRYSVSFVGSLVDKCEQVAVVCGLTSEPYDCVLANGVRAVGVGCSGDVDVGALTRATAATDPTHLVVATPQLGLLRWVAKTNRQAIAVLADSFDRQGLRGRLKSWRMARALNDEHFDWVGNHGLNACISLLDIGLSADRVVPWDWPSSKDPHSLSPRTRDGGPFKLTYVGGVIEAKGVGDLIDAIALLNQRGLPVTATINGHDAGGLMRDRAEMRGLRDLIEFVGVVPNEQVPDIMMSADAVVVPSRHSYPEGLPLTIYEALSTRTPILASDHPMFKGALCHRYSAMIFPASDSSALAESIIELEQDKHLYGALSANSVEAWRDLQLPVLWGDLIGQWLNAEEGRAWIMGYSIASGRYDERLMKRRDALSAKSIK